MENNSSEISFLKGGYGLPKWMIGMLLIIFFLSGVIVGIVINTSDYSKRAKFAPVRKVSDSTRRKRKVLPSSVFKKVKVVDENVMEKLDQEVVKMKKVEKVEDEKATAVDGGEKKEVRQVPKWIKNSIPVDEKKLKKNLVAIVIDDMGIDFIRTGRVLKELSELEPLTLSYLTYVPNLARQMEKGRGFGHEIMLHVAMEPHGEAYDMGPEPLLTSMSDSKIKNTLNSLIAKSSGIVGVNNHMGSKFTSDRSSISSVIEVIKSKGLLFLDSLTDSKSVADEVALKYKIPFIRRDVFLDDSGEKKDIDLQIKRLEEMARKTGYAVAIGHPRDATIEALKEWAETLDKKDISIVPISYIIKKKAGIKIR